MELIKNNGDWDGKTIWRERTAAELLLNEIEKNKQEKEKPAGYPDKFTSEREQEINEPLPSKDNLN